MRTFIGRNCYEFHCLEQHGKSQRKLLFLHGFLGEAYDWRQVIQECDASIQCQSLDLPGHGKTRVVGDDSAYTMERTALALRQWIVGHNSQKIHLVGYSMGGRLALYMAVYFPELISSCTLISASPGITSESKRKVRREKDKELAVRMVQQDFEDFLKFWYKQPLFTSFRRNSTFSAIFRRRLQADPNGLAMSLAMMGTGMQRPLWQALPRVRLPVMMIVGYEDRKFVRIAEEMKRMNHRFRLVTLLRCGHVVHLERTKALGKLISDFVLGDCNGYSMDLSKRIYGYTLPQGRWNR